MKNKITTGLILLIVLAVMLSTLAPAQIIIVNHKKIDDQKSFEIKYKVTFSEKDFQFEKVMGYDLIKLPESGQLTEIGKPALPLKIIMIALPQDMEVRNIRILEEKEKIIPGFFTIFPTQEPQYISNFSQTSTYILSIDPIYKSSESYPSKWIELVGQTDLAGQSLAIIKVYPFHYIPNLKQLNLLTSIEFIIEGVDGYICGDYLSESTSEPDREIYNKIIKDLVINPEDVALNSFNINIYPLGVDPGDYDYVIITKSDWEDDFQPLADWKTKKGKPAKIVTTEWIYSEYSGSSKEKIRAFIEDAYNTWGTTFFLLGGDTSTIPYHTVNYVGSTIPTDTYYSDYDDDWMCEVHVGRASVYQTGSDAGGIDKFISKVLGYEKNPPTTNFAKRVALFGFDLNAATPGENCKDDIEELYIPIDWSVTKVYDSDSGNHEDEVDSVVNNGQNLINHIDHSNQNYMGTGYTNHGWGLYSSEVDEFSNGNKQSTWYSIGCYACAYDYDNCIAEHFVRDTNGGGVAFIGNSRYGWFYSGNDDLASLRYDRYLFKSLFEENHYKIGHLFSDHKMDAYASMDPDSYNKYIFSELTLLGDPEMPIWTDNPKNFVVNHPSQLPIGSSSFTVHVETSGGENINNAYVCLWKDDEVYLTGWTSYNGDVIFNPSPDTTGIMYVTVTKQDFKPHESSAVVLEFINDPPYLPNNPNPEHGAVDVPIYSTLSWLGGDPNPGDSVVYDVYFGTSLPLPKVSDNQPQTTYDPGLLDYETTYLWQIIAMDNHGASTEGPVWHFTTESSESNKNPEFLNENPKDNSKNIPINLDLLSINIKDFEGDSFNWNIETYPDIGSSSGTNEDNGTKNCIISGLTYDTTYTWYVNATDSGSNKWTREVYSFTTENEPSIDPDLKCTGDLFWENVKAGKKVKGTLYIENVGYSESKLDWEIVEWPQNWGEWIFTPSFGIDLTPNDGKVSVDVTVTAPNQENEEFIGKVKIVNSENVDDFEIISVSLKTPRNRLFFNLPFINFLNNNPHIFLLIKQILQIFGL